MAAAPSMTEVVLYLSKHPPQLADGVIAERATALLRQWGISSPKERVSRPLVNMARRGKLRRAAGVKARAIWQAMLAAKLIPALPAEIAAAETLTPRRKASTVYNLRRRVQMLEARLRGQTLEEVKEVPMLTNPMLKYFGLDRNPVFDEIASERDVWWSEQHKEQESVLVDAVEGAKFVRVSGRRGAGKSLVAEIVKRRLVKRDDVIIVEPSATVTRIVTETHLITSIIQAIKRKVDGRDEIFAEAQSPAKRALAMRYLLIQQKRAGRRVALWIDEAHELDSRTFLALKRFLDELDGVGRRLLGVVLIGQNPEAAYNPRARDLSEVTLRLQTFRIQPMNDEMPGYLAFKIQRAGGRPSDIITPQALKAIGARCPYPLDANAFFAQLLIEAYADKKRPIQRDRVEAVPHDEEMAEEATGS